MSRTRAERRHNTHVKTTSRKKAAANDLYCTAKITPSGEACACKRCDLSKRYEESYVNHWNNLQLSSFMISFNE